VPCPCAPTGKDLTALNQARPWKRPRLGRETGSCFVLTPRVDYGPVPWKRKSADKRKKKTNPCQPTHPRLDGPHQN